MTIRPFDGRSLVHKEFGGSPFPSSLWDTRFASNKCESLFEGFNQSIVVGNSLMRGQDGLMDEEGHGEAWGLHTCR